MKTIETIHLETEEYTVDLVTQMTNGEDRVTGHITLNAKTDNRFKTQPLDVMPRFPQTVQFMGTRINLSLLEKSDGYELMVSLPTVRRKRWRGIVQRWQHFKDRVQSAKISKKQKALTA